MSARIDCLVNGCNEPNISWADRVRLSPVSERCHT